MISQYRKTTCVSNLMSVSGKTVTRFQVYVQPRKDTASCMRENDISINEIFCPKYFMDENSMHEIAYSLVFHEYLRGEKVIQG